MLFERENCVVSLDACSKRHGSQQQQYVGIHQLALQLRVQLGQVVGH
jgi:hypothetical protein